MGVDDIGALGLGGTSGADEGIGPEAPASAGVEEGLDDGSSFSFSFGGEAGADGFASPAATRQTLVPV